MRRILLALFVGIICLAAQPAKAAFPVHKMKHAATTTVLEQQSEGRHKLSLKKISTMAKAALHMYQQPVADKPGWPGVVSLVCAGAALLSLLGVGVLFLPFSIGAIVFGIVGLNSKYKNQGMATAGLVLGIIELVFFIIAIVLIAAFLAAW